jgi:hypothetical protein
MAGDEGSTKFAPVGQYGTGYTPTVTQLHFTPVQYANYAPMLQAIEAAGSNVLNYLNPSTIAKMKLDVASSQAGRNWLTEIQKPENRAYWLGQSGISGGRYESVPGYVNPMLRVGPIEKPSDSTETKVNPTTKSPNPGNTQNNATVTNQPNTQNNATVTNPADPYDYFANQGAGTALHYQQGGPVYAAPPTAVPPPPPPADQSGALPGHIPYSQESQAQAFSPTQGAPLSQEAIARQQAQKAQEQQNLTAWQNQTQGGIMSAVEARDWAKHAIDTDITRAVYLPQGGPANASGQKEPAYAFYGKKAGAANVVPISQMVKAGAGPLVAAGNLTQMLSSADQQKQPPQAQAPQQQQPQQPQPLGAPPQGGGPPAAPGPNVAGQLPQDEFARRVAAATNVPNAGGPPVSQLTAGTNEAGVSGTNQAGLINVPDPAEVAGLENNYRTNGSKTQNDTGDPAIGTTMNGWNWYKSDGGTGPAYAERPGPGGFIRERYYLGDDHWQPVTPPEQSMRQSLFEVMPQLGYDAIKNMDAKTLQSNLAAYWNMKNLTPMSDQANQQLNEERQRILSFTRVLDATKDQDPQNFNSTALWENSQVRNLNAKYTKNPSTPAEYANNFLSLITGAATVGAKKEDPRLTTVQNEYDKLMHYEAGLVPGAPMTDAQRQAADNALGGLLTGSPNSREQLTRRLNDVKASFQQHYLGAVANNQKVAGMYDDMSKDLAAGKPLYDKDAFGGPKGKPGTGIEAQVEQSAKGNPSASPTQPPAAPGPTAPRTGPGSSQDNPLHVTSLQQYQNVAPGTWMMDDQGHVKPKR